MKNIQLNGIFSEGYGIVPKLLMKADDISSNTKIVLCYLLSYTGAGVHSYPNMEQIATDLKISRRTVSRCIANAYEAGYIHINKKFLGRGHGTSYEYVLMFMGDSPFLKDKEKANAKLAHANNARASVSNASESVSKKEQLHVTQVPHNKNNININNLIITKGIVIPHTHNCNDFFDMLKEWIDYKKEIKNKYTETGIVKLINKLTQHSLSEVREAIDNAISNGWKGIFFNKQFTTKQSKQDEFIQNAKNLYYKLGENNDK